MLIQMLPKHASAGPLFCPVAKGGFRHARRELRPTHFLGLVDPGEASPIQKLPFLWHDLLGRSLVLTAVDDDSIDFSTVLSIVRFGEGLKQRSRILVHCHHGRSRSTAAVAIMVAQTHGVTAAQSMLREWQQSTFHQPNARMLRIASTLLGMRLDIEAIPKLPIRPRSSAGRVHPW